MNTKEGASINRPSIQTLHELFSALFRPGEGERPVLRQPQRPLREELFALFFPDALVCQYADKSKSNLTWFFNNDPRNKSVRRSLIALLAQDARGMVADAHRKARLALWPVPGYAVFDGPALRQTLGRVRLPGTLDSRWHILEAGEGRTSRLDVFFEADEAGALARLLLTLAVGEDLPGEAMAGLWGDGADAACDFMGGDDSFSGRLRYCRMLDLQGHHERAFEGFERLARELDGPATTGDESALYGRLGEMLFNGEGCVRDERAALAYDRRACLDERPRSWYQLARHDAGTAARQAMERSAELGYAPAIRQLGDAWVNGSARLACTRSPEAARRVFQRGLTLPGADGAYCACRLGQLYEAQGEREAALSAYRVAREGGSAEAAGRLARLDWMPGLERESRSIGRGRAPAGLKGCCLTNALTGCNLSFLEGLTGRWEIAVCDARPGLPLPDGARQSRADLGEALFELAAGVYWGGAPSFPELLVALLSGDARRNVSDAVRLLEALNRLAESLGERAWDLADQVEIYVLARRDEAAPLLDAAFAGMGERYFRLRLCDPDLDAADRLFFAAPLFLPRLRAPEDAPVRLKLIGCGEASMAVLRRALALPLPEAADFSVDVYGKDAGGMARRFRQLCPGAAWGELLGIPSPGFHECDPEEELEEALDSGNYYVVAAGDDGLNLRLGMLLRRELMRRDPGAERQPFIAVHVAEPGWSWLAAGIPAGPEGSEAAPAHGSGLCELFPFGGLDMYAPEALASEALERRARQAHTLFVGLPNTRDARHAALGGYYRRQSSRESARMTALSLAYRMHLAGISLPGWRLYGVPEEERRLGAEYTRWLRQGENLRQAVRDEHARRNRVLAAEGWAPASEAQVAACVARGNPGPILYPAKLTPFLCPWEALEDGELLRRLREIVRARFPEKSVPDPRRDEEASVRDTEGILGGDI